MQRECSESPATEQHDDDLRTDGGLAPECRVSGCHATAERSREHPDLGAVDVCPTCSKLFEEEDA